MISVLTVLFRSLILYAVVIFSVRLMGKRQLGEVQPGELVITILISNIATLPIENTALPLLPGLVPILTLVCLEVVMSYFAMRSKKLRRLVSGSPKIVIRDGKIMQQTMLDLRLTTDDLLMALRSNQIFTPDDVQFAIVETTGSVSVYPKAGARELVQDDIGINKPSCDPPIAVVSDGEILEKALSSLGYDRSRLAAELQAFGLTAEETFLAMADANGVCTAVRKER